MTTLVIGIVLIVGGIAFAAFPFFKRPTPGKAPVAPKAPAGAARRAMRAESAPSPIVAELEELELDRAMGKLDEADYQRLRGAIEARARVAIPSAAPSPVASTPARAGTVPEDESVAAELSAEAVSSATSQATTPPASSRPELEAEAERLIRAQRAQEVSCGTCGPRPEPGARFCSHCGRAIGGCPACGATVKQPGARFCDQCGAALVA
jgi:hypothetical protein